MRSASQSYGVNLASAVHDLKASRGLDAGAGERRTQAQNVLLTFLPPVGMYLVQKDLNRCWQVGEESREVPATS